MAKHTITTREERIARDMSRGYETLPTMFDFVTAENIREAARQADQTVSAYLRDLIWPELERRGLTTKRPNKKSKGWNRNGR